MTHESYKRNGKQHVHILNEIWLDEGCFRWSYLLDEEIGKNEMSLYDANQGIGTRLFSCNPTEFWILVYLASIAKKINFPVDKKPE
jgi:hypothetical protein